MGIKIGLVGLGSFGKAFSPLFTAHPLVDAVALCDAEEDRVQDQYERLKSSGKISEKDLTTSFDEICKSDCDALAIITQPWLHAPQCIQAMESGKTVYSAVPVISLPDYDEILDWCGKIIETVQKTGKEYMLGETTFYRPQTMFCKRMAQQNLFGDFVYAEAEYAHDLDSWCSLREVSKSRQQGKVGQQAAAFLKKYYDRGCKTTPFSYPTHSVSGVTEVMRSKAKKVAAIGYRNRNNDPFFAHSEFSNVTAFFQMENGAAFRCAELREISANIGLHDEDFRIYGTRGSYAYNDWRNNGRTEPTPEIKPNVQTKVTDAEMRDPLPPDVAFAFNRMLNGDQVKEGDDFVPAGHGGSHPYLVHEFVSSVAENRRPAISAWDAAMYMAMGAAADLSARKDGEWVDVVDFGKTWD